jgi:glycosyltransferase involved in cell wall biosynthesis
VTVLQVLSSVWLGGLERVVEMLATGLAARGHDVRVVVFAAPGAAQAPVVSSLRSGGIDVETRIVPGRAYLQERRETIELCRRVGPAVVHTHGYRADVLDAPGARRDGFPTVTTAHGFAGGDLKNRLYEGLQIRAFRRFDAVVAVSARMADFLVARGVPSARVHTIVNAWRPGPPPLARAAARAALGVSPDGFRVGFVGRLSREKGADVLLEALARLRPHGVLASVLGDGRERRALEAAAARLGIADAVTWHGVVPDAGLLMPAFDALVMPSRTEGTPVALFEAMAASVPAVVTAVGGVPDVVSDADVILVLPDRPGALADAILRVRRDPNGARGRAESARRRLADRFGDGPWLDAYERLYAQVLSARAR